jgi:hypothetical protein
MRLGGSENYSRWDRITTRVAEEGNAIVYDFLKLTPRVLIGPGGPAVESPSFGACEAVLDVVAELTGNVFTWRSNASALRERWRLLRWEQFRAWAHEGGEHRQDRRRAQAYYASIRRRARRS